MGSQNGLDNKKKSRFGSSWLRGLATLPLLVILLSAYQNCTWEASNSGFKGAQHHLRSSSGNGESYDGKPEPDYVRRVPGHTCGGKASEYGSLDLQGDQALLTIMNGDACSETKTIDVSDLDQSPNTDVVIGYRDGIYTKSDSELSTSPESFTEVWCQHKSKDKTRIIADIIIQWEQAGERAKGYVFTDQGVNSIKTSMGRRIWLNEVRYWGEDLTLVIHKVSTSGREGRYSGYYRDIERYGYDKIPVECRLGGQFDPAAPQLSYPQSSVIWKVGEPIPPFDASIDQSEASFQINKPLPEGLSFNVNTGQISGTPLTPQKRELYEVKAMFKFGEVVTPLFIGTGQSIAVTTSDTTPQATYDTSSCLNSAGECSLRAALSLAKAAPERPLIIDLPAGVYPLSEELIVSGDIVLSGNKSEPAVFDGQTQSRIFKVEPGSSLEINHLQLKNGRAAQKGAAIMASDATVIVKNSIFENNSVVESGESQGGAIYLTQSDAFEVYDSKFLNNSNSHATRNPYGGAIYLYEVKNTIIKRSEFSNNQSPNGAAVYSNSFGDGLVLIEETNFTNNRSIFYGGAVSLDGGRILIASSTFDGNFSEYYGGAIYSELIRSMKVVNSNFTRNESRAGSAIYSAYQYVDTSFIIDRSRFIQNQMNFKYGWGPDNLGAVLYGREGDFMLKESTLKDNPNQVNCEMTASEIEVYNATVTSFGGNEFDDRTCNPIDSDLVQD